jgi:hypothetical protein
MKTGQKKARKYMKRKGRFWLGLIPIPIAIIAILFFPSAPRERIVLNLTSVESCALHTLFTDFSAVEMCSKYSFRYPRDAYPANLTSIETSFGPVWVRIFGVGEGGVLMAGEISKGILPGPESLQNLSVFFRTINGTWNTEPDVYRDGYGRDTLFYDIDRGDYREIMDIKMCPNGALMYYIMVPLEYYAINSVDIIDSIASIRCLA